jgi:hypothetical protein
VTLSHGIFDPTCIEMVHAQHLLGVYDPLGADGSAAGVVDKAPPIGP